jgi:hypothetical protein
MLLYFLAFGAAAFLAAFFFGALFLTTLPAAFFAFGALGFLGAALLAGLADPDAAFAIVDLVCNSN